MRPDYRPPITDYLFRKYFLTMHPTRGKVFTTSNEEEKSSPLRPA